MEEQPVINTQVQQPTPPAPKRHSFLTSKLFLIALTIVVLFTIVYAGIYLYLGSQLDKISKSNQTAITNAPSPTPNPTANWKTYRNEFLGFSIKYPSNVQISEQKPNAGGFIAEAIAVVGLKLPVPTHPANIGVAYGASITVYKSINDSRIYAAVKKNSKAVRVSNYPALYYYEATEAFPIHSYFLTNGGKLYEISTETSDETLDLFDQILSTFKFTDQDQVVCAADAKLCPDGSYVSRQPPNCEFAACS